MESEKNLDSDRQLPAPAIPTDSQPSPQSFVKSILATHWRFLLLLLIGVYLPLQVFAVIAIKVWQHEGIFPWDVPILQAIHATTNVQLDVFAATLTKLGSRYFVFPVVGAIALVLASLKKWRSLTYLVTITVGSAMINYTAKILFHRVRPHLWESSAPELDYAFPSGHSMTSMTLIAALVILTWGSAWCWLILTVGSLFVLAIGWTRLYLGVHFPSDILAGWMLSIAWTIAVDSMLRFYPRQKLGRESAAFESDR
jgi:membrane-associated phospholipid phosphatase